MPPLPFLNKDMNEVEEMHASHNDSTGCGVDSLPSSY